MIKNHNIKNTTLTLEIKSKKARFLDTFHPWIFSGAIKSDISTIDRYEAKITKPILIVITIKLYIYSERMSD